MIRRNGYLMALPVAAAAITAAAFADPSSSNYTYQQTTETQSTTTPVVDTELSARNARAAAVHNEAVYLAHQSTVSAQEGNKRYSEKLAAEAEQFYNQAFRIEHPGMFAHETGQQ